jgi:hypothetical protein
MKYIHFFLICFMILNLTFSHAQTRKLDSPFFAIRVSSKLVKLTVEKINSTHSVCAVEVINQNEKFSFVIRRAVSHERCMGIIIDSRRVLNSNNKVLVVGSIGSNDGGDAYSAQWEFILGENQMCSSYFPNSCDRYILDYPELLGRPIDIERN